MKKILIIGAGKSSAVLIQYLSDSAQELGWYIKVADRSIETAREKTVNLPLTKAVSLDIFDDRQLEEEISGSDIVVSMLPSDLHGRVIEQCIRFAKPLVTASYVTPDISAMHDAAAAKHIPILMECGVDPGIDHMSAVRSIEELRSSGATIKSFKSFVGGLPAPESDNNPWHYKFTWNPRNVISAGRGYVKFIRNGKYKYLPYHAVFSRLETVRVKGFGEFEAYPNRDSLRYREIYGLSDIPTIFRGTLRRPGFCEAWNVFVQLGLTADDYTVEDSENITYHDFINSFLAYGEEKTVEQKLASYLGVAEDSALMERLKWTGIFSERRIGLKGASPAAILLHLLEDKWRFEEHDKDMIVMQHRFEYTLDDREEILTSSVVILGDDATHTAMAKSVGYPLAIAVKLILTEKINPEGVHIPVLPEIRNPILEELELLGIRFSEDVASLN